MPQKTKKTDLTRRHFLRLSGMTVLASMVVFNRPLAAAVLTKSDTDRGLRLHNIHTGENLDCIYWSQGIYNPRSLSAIDRLLRDHRTGDIHPIDPALLDLMSRIADHLKVAPVFHVVSGFRSKRTNQALRNQGRKVAGKSFHILGKAVDIRMPEVDVVQLHKAALALQQGGVGLYRGRDFVHIDTGPVRQW